MVFSIDSNRVEYYLLLVIDKNVSNVVIFQHCLLIYGIVT